MSSTVSSLIGRKPVQEFTGCAAIPAMIAPMGVALKRRRLIGKTADDRNKKPIKEENKGIIPDNAEPIDSATGLKTSDMTDDKADKPADQTQTGELLPTSLALVAPDCTPNWNVPLSPSLIPKSQPKAEPAAPPSPTEEPAEEPVLGQGYTQQKDRPLSVEGMIGLGRSGRASPADASVAAHFVSGVIQDSAPVAKTPEELLGQGKPMPAHVTSNSSSRLMTKFRFSE